MLGLLRYERWRGPGLRLERGQVLGLPVLMASVDPGSLWFPAQVSRAGRGLRRAGVRRVLAPEDFALWGRLGLPGVDCLPFLRCHAAPLALAALEKRGWQPEGCTVALRGEAAEEDMIRAARELIPRVRCLCVRAERGGEALGEWLLRHCGAAVCPDSPEVPCALRFSPESPPGRELTLSLCRPWDLGEVRPTLAQAPETPLPLLCALWGCGRLGGSDLIYT